MGGWLDIGLSTTHLSGGAADPRSPDPFVKIYVDDFNTLSQSWQHYAYSKKKHNYTNLTTDDYEKS